MQIPPALERVLDSLRYEALIWRTNFFISLARIRIVASGHLNTYWKKRLISFFIKEEDFACFESIFVDRSVHRLINSTCIEEKDTNNFL